MFIYVCICHINTVWSIQKKRRIFYRKIMRANMLKRFVPNLLKVKCCWSLARNHLRDGKRVMGQWKMHRYCNIRNSNDIELNFPRPVNFCSGMYSVAVLYIQLIFLCIIILEHEHLTRETKNYKHEILSQCFVFYSSHICR